MSSDDFIYLIAHLSPDANTALAWDKGGEGVVKGWAAMMRRKRG
jgi:hypothetical protein